MTNLQLGIIGIGLLAIVGVLFYNWWQEKRIQQRINQQFPTNEFDPLLGSSQADNTRTDPSFVIEGKPELGEDGLPKASVVQQHEEEGVDPMCETVFDIHFFTPVNGTQLLQHIQQFKYAGNKPIRYFAETADGFHRARIRASELYSSLQMAVQLANRQGSLRSEEWDQAFMYADNIAHAFDATIESGDKKQVLEQALQLDQLCNESEAQVGVKLALDGTQPLKAILEIAQRLGYQEYGLGHVRMHESGKPLFLLLPGGELSSEVRSAGVDFIELLIDVPNSHQIEKPFTHLVKHAHELAKALNAQVVDDEGQALNRDNAVIPVVDQQLAEVYQDLDTKGLRAGSERAARLFS